jgi:VWFA-related protein
MSTLSFLLIALLISIQQSPSPSASNRPSQEKRESQDSQLRLKTDLVQVRAVVTDKRGQPVAGLKKEDFELLEENRPQAISFFSVEDVTTPADSQRSGGVSTLRTPTEDAARTIVLFVDTVHISFENLARTKQAVRRFVDEQMTDRDMVALVTSSGALGLMEQFTHDRQLLRAAVERLTAWRVSMQETLFTPYLAAQIAQGDRRSLFLGIEIVRAEEMRQKEVRDRFAEEQTRSSQKLHTGEG